MAHGKTEKCEQDCYKGGTVLFMYLTGLGIRYWLMFSRYQSIIANHIEISTPLNSWKRVSEGLCLQSKGINPYEGDLLHEAPITILFYKVLTQWWKLDIKTIFLAFDAGTAVVLYFVAKKYMFHLFIEQEENKKQYALNSKEFLLSGSDFVNSPVFVASAFLFNPYTIFNCVGQSTVVFHNFFIALFLFCMLSGSVILSVLSLAICTMMSFYPIVLIIPLFLYSNGIYKSKFRAILTPILFIATLAAFITISIGLSNGTAFMKNVYGFILTVPDLQPNIGLFWYFFTEMFDHFRDLFISSFQINATVLYLIPLSVKFRKDPFLLTFAILCLISVFKSYPCLGDVGFVLSLLPCFIHLFNYSQQGFLVGVIFLITTALGPILWHLWIYSNSANANFYFGVTLAFAIAQIFLVTDILFAYLKREFCLNHGKERKIDGKDALLILE
ncbi:phosphatidylinositol glycan anchor biosynthesis class U protein [Tribolium castaneum]|uniref:Phosphatidylinositol glycan anchor biosynthesis class U protein-like Protein n=1 Tax=Tribolium castaneum TaxID=7070 RepID=D6WSK6_TRICA|nr:PREDICTED: phosphatidylinositol glycan anchor biosynthesis class U protein [Tribolium castaneum]EFA07117.1 Phosphatidylinositol glycan anchor biosynthesis class U protein-like Protein [Tribolium castaneum]|eukprot:XP_969270.1 PREDICTED: phosphatidylinositol glycan anchor biosynthesis class U protein [Tribolium castaneum]